VSQLSDEQLEDIALAYSCDEILDILGVEPSELVDLLREQIEQNILKFNFRPVDCNTYDI
jgi:hypothetical protein|tara:strand:- start:1352 stop:1531 length:180 start_codon:yes stop_codon:yes gene_type:complete